MKEPQSPIEQLALAQLRARLDEVEAGELIEAAQDAALGVLRDEELAEDERATLENNALDESVDPVGIVLGQRIERAIASGLEAADVVNSPRVETGVIVLRSLGASDRSLEEKRLRGAVAKLQAHIQRRMKGEGGHLLLVAAGRFFDKVKKLVPQGKIGSLPTVEFTEEGPRESGTTASIEVVSAEVGLEQLEQRASDTVESIRRSSVDVDSIKAAWLAADTKSGDTGDAAAIARALGVAGGLEADDADLEPASSEAPAAPAVPAGELTPEGDVDPMIGELFHFKYRIVKCIGKGGFGSVYEAVDERGAGNRIAIKVLSGKAAESAAQHQSFKDEARRVTRLSHPNIVDWKTFDETEGGVPYFVMELVEGEEFEETLLRERKIEPERAAKLLLQVLGALRAAHHLSDKESILHLDLKPANLFRIPGRHGREEQLKVIDFGIGQYIGDGEVRDEEVVPAEGLSMSEMEGGTLTFARPRGSGDTTGGVARSKGCTPEYASPEQCDHVLFKDDIVGLDGRSDLYSLGVIAFEMLTGQMPFKSKTRLDVMRMHQEEPAPHVGSMGSRIPRKLAKFVDRCLQKDRDHRWRDTKEAYDFLDEIVHPPVWKAVAKVTVPIVLAGVAIGSWAYVTREVPVPTCGLLSADGADLATNPVFLGPQNGAVSIQLDAADGVLPADASGQWAVVRAADGSVLEDWTADWSSSGAVSLAAPSGITGRIEERVELVLDEDELRSSPMSLVWIGSGSWEVGDVRLGDRPVDELQDVEISPFGTVLDVIVRGEARGDVADVSVTVGEADPLSLGLGTSSGDQSLYRLALADAALAQGANELTLRIRDAAGAEWTRELALDVVHDELTLDRLSVVDAAGERAPNGEWPESNKILDAFMISPRTKPVLRAELSRVADFSWKLFVEGFDEPEMRGSAEGRRSVEAALDGLETLRSGEPYRGRIEVIIDEGAYVLHSKGSGRGKVTRAIPFSFEDMLPGFTAQWREAGGGRATRDLVRADDGEDPAVLFTNSAESEVRVTRTQPVPMRVEVAFWHVDAADEVESKPSMELHNPQNQQASIPVVLDEDGDWRIRVRSYRYDTAAKTIGGRPDVEELFHLVLDREAPRAALVGLSGGQVLTSLDSAPSELSVRFGELAAGVREPAIDLRWRLVQSGSNQELGVGGLFEGHDPMAGAARVDLEDSLRGGAQRDGAYRIELSGVDRAGNALREASVEFILAARGPELTLEEPSGIGKWRPDTLSGRWVVRVLATDPNGVGDVTCELRTENGALPVSLVAEAGSSPVEQALIGSVLLTHELSETRVRLALTATDEHGSSSTHESGEIELPTITRPEPERIAARRGSRAVEAMSLVRGNADAQYLFGGRGDTVENADFVRAGLGPFNGAPRRSRSRSWRVPFEPGEIEDYYLDEHEVSIAQFMDFLDDPLGYGNPGNWPTGARPDEGSRHALRHALSGQPGDVPVSGVTWSEAYAYARWVGKRLPSWLEWEYAVRGGAEYRPSSVAAGTGGVIRAAQGAEAAAPRGSGDWTPGRRLADLCGNVAEWTSTGFDASSVAARYPHHWALEDPARLQASSVAALSPGTSQFWVVGGHFEKGRLDFAAADHRPADFRHATIGFRCALSLSAVQDRLGIENPNGTMLEELP